MKQLVYCYLCLKVFIKAVTIVFLAVTDTSKLPAIVFGASIVLVMAGIVVVARHRMSRLKTNEMAMFFFAEVIITIFNLVFISSTSLVEIGMTGMIVTGSLLDVMIALISIFALMKLKPAYVSIAKKDFSSQDVEISGKAS